MSQLISDVCQGLSWEPLWQTCWVAAPGMRMVSVQGFGHLGWSSRQSGVGGSGKTGPGLTGLLSLGNTHHLSWASVSSFDTFFQEAL